MNTHLSIPKLKFYPCFCGLAVLLIVAARPVFAQSSLYYQSESTPLIGYWQLHTNPISQNTLIRFFDAQEQLIYQEQLPGQYIRLTKRTVRVFDELLEQLETKRLLTSRLQSQVMTLPKLPNRREKKPFEKNVSIADTVLVPGLQRVYCTVNSNGKLILNLLNPSAEILTIRLVDDSDRIMYKNHTNQKEYFSRMNVSSLANGQFRLTISNQKGKDLYAFRLTIKTTNLYELQPLRRVSASALAVTSP